MKNPIPSLLSACKQAGVSVSSWFRPSAAAPVASASPRSFNPRAWLAGRDDYSSSVALVASPLLQSSWVYACVTTLADTVSSIPFRIVPEPGASSAAQNPQLAAINQLFNRPHPQLDRFQFWELVVSWIALRGEAFIYPVRHSLQSRNPYDQLLVLNPDDLQEIVRDRELQGWRYNSPAHQPSAATHILLPEELIHIKLPNPYNFWRGLSPLTVAWLAAQTDYAASQFMKGTMINNADTGLIVSSSDQLTPEQIEEISACLRDRKRSAGSADRPLFLWGNTRVERPGMTAVDLQFLDNRKFNRQEICAIFKVPQEILGYTEDANRSVAECARLNFMEHRIIPLCRRLEAAIDPIIRKYDPRLRGEFHVKGTPVMQAAQRQRVDTATKLFMLGVPMDAINDSLDLGLPPLPHGSDSFLPANVSKVGGSSPPSLDPDGKALIDQIYRAHHHALAHNAHAKP